MDRIEKALKGEQAYAYAALSVLNRAAFIINNGAEPCDAILQLVIDSVECGIVDTTDLRYVLVCGKVPDRSST